MKIIERSTFEFFEQLSEHNNRDWFNENKPRYQAEHAKVISFVDNLLMQIKAYDQVSNESGKKSLMRIYRDIRFSKNKLPYNPRFAGSFSRIKPQLRGSYFFSIAPGATVVGGGFYGPEKDDLKLIRDHIAQDDEPLRSVVVSKSFIDTFGALQGDQLKTAPKGFPKDHPSMDLLKYKSLYAFREFTDAEVLAPNFQDQMMETFIAIRPFFDVMTEMLTTDLNGLSLIE